MKQAGIERLAVPPEQAASWQQAGFTVVSAGLAELKSRVPLAVPGIAPRRNRASATQSPWVNSNGWRFLRDSQGKYLYKLPAGRAVLAAAETFAYGADALLEIDPADLADLGAMLSFLAQLPEWEAPPVGDFGVVDDGTPLVGEVMNLLVRRNLLFAPLRAPSPQFRINVQVGSKEYSKREAADPSALALKIRRQVGDEQRTLRLFGSEGVIARLTGDGGRRRLHLLNYGGRALEGLRVRVRGEFPEGAAFIVGAGRVPLEERVVEAGATEFTLARIGAYAAVELQP